MKTGKSLSRLDVVTERAKDIPGTTAAHAQVLKFKLMQINATGPVVVITAVGPVHNAFGTYDSVYFSKNVDFGIIVTSSVCPLRYTAKAPRYNIAFGS